MENRDPAFGWAFMERFSDRILFGTDICDPANDHRHAEYLRRSLADGKLSQETFEKIAWRNANDLFRFGLLEIRVFSRKALVPMNKSKIINQQSAILGLTGLTSILTWCPNICTIKA